jgi:hypothetical protein
MGFEIKGEIGFESIASNLNKNGLPSCYLTPNNKIVLPTSPLHPPDSTIHQVAPVSN